MKCLLIKIFVLFAVVFAHTSLYGQNDYIDSLTTVLKQHTAIDTTRAKIENDIAFELFNLSLYDEAIKHYHQVFEISQQIGYQKGMYSYLNGIASIQFRQNKLDEALQTFDSLERAMIKGKTSKQSLGVLYNGIANVYEAKDEYNQAIDYSLKALDLFNQAGNENYSAIVLGNIASIYFKVKDYKSASKFHEQSIEVKKRIGNDYSLGIAYLNYAQVFERLGNYQKHIDLLQKSIRHFENINDSADIALCKTSLGLAYIALSDSSLNGVSKENTPENSKEKLLTKALQYEHEALAIYKAIGEQYEVGHTLNAIGTALVNQEKYKEAIPYYQKVYQQFYKTRLNLAKASAEGLAYAYEHLGDYKNAFTWQKKYLELVEKINENTDLLDLGKKQAKIIFQQEQEIKELEHQKELAENTLKHQEIETQLLLNNSRKNKWLLLAFLVILSISFIFYTFRKKMKTKALFLKEKAEKEALKAKIEGEESERERIARELHDGVASALTGIRLQYQAQKSTGKTLDTQLQEVNQEIRDISHRLATPLVQQFATVNELVNDCIHRAFAGRTYTINTSFHPENDTLLFTEEQRLNLYRILQEIFQNINKHAQATEISVSYNRHQRQLNFIIEDNGVGFNTNTTTFGIGLNNIKKRVESMGGTFTIDSAQGRGTCFILDFEIQ